MRLVRMILSVLLVGIGLLGLGTPALAGAADVIDAVAVPQGDGTWRFDVTVRSADTGWDGYADRWEIVGPDGNVLATRVLHHPHENEQPFTRSLSGVRVPVGVEEVTIRAHHSARGYDGEALNLALPDRS